MDENVYDINHFELMITVSAYFNALSAEILEHHYAPESFGSWWCTFRKSDNVFRLVYDGRDSFFFLEIDSNKALHASNINWTDIGYLKTVLPVNNDSKLKTIKTIMSNFFSKNYL